MHVISKLSNIQEANGKSKEYKCLCYTKSLCVKYQNEWCDDPLWIVASDEKFPFERVCFHDSCVNLGWKYFSNRTCLLVFFSGPSLNIEATNDMPFRTFHLVLCSELN